jgi:hypothetical protein
MKYLTFKRVTPATAAVAYIAGIVQIAIAAALFLAVASMATARGETARPWQVATRIRVTEGNAASIGSGTVIASTKDGAYVLTCAHIFPKGTTPQTLKRPITVDLFDGVLTGANKNQVTFARTMPGQCVDFDHTMDVGLILIQPGSILPALPPVEKGWLPHQGESLTAVGCGEAHDATAWMTSAIDMTTSNGYRGIVCKYGPQQGRSGGGLHRADGRVCGICDFNSTSDDTGIYAAPESIHNILDRNGLTWIYTTTARPERRPQAEPATPVAPIPRPQAPAPPIGPPLEEHAGKLAYGYFDPRDPFHYVAVIAIAIIAWHVHKGGRYRQLEQAVFQTLSSGPVGQSDKARYQADLLTQVQELMNRFKEHDIADKQEAEAKDLMSKFQDLIAATAAPKAA